MCLNHPETTPPYLLVYGEMLGTTAIEHEGKAQSFAIQMFWFEP